MGPGEFAEKLGVTADTVYKWERGDATPSGSATILLKQLADGVKARAAKRPPLDQKRIAAILNRSQAAADNEGRPRKCPDCKGRGAANCVLGRLTCGRCGGSGKIGRVK